MEEQKILRLLEQGKLKMHEIEKHVKDANEAAKIRRTFIEKKFGKKLALVGSHAIDFSDAINRNIENPIGATQVPLGYSGELKIRGDFANGAYPIFLATTEGKLVAGISRGIKALNESNGVNAYVVKDGMTRDILIRVEDANEASQVTKWVNSKDGFEFLKGAFAVSTKHGSLNEVKPYAIGREIHLRFRADTGSAMGMNMLTIAASHATEEMAALFEKRRKIKIRILSESGNMCADKKPALVDFIEGRGVSVIADAYLPNRVVQKAFGVKPEAIAEINVSKNLQGSALAGSHGYNAHVANVLAAMYIAHGQDVAQIVEGSQAMTSMAVKGSGLYISLYLPAIEVGTYGGGTKRETQKEILELIGLYGENDNEGITRKKFAEVVAGACLAGELNLLAAESGLDLARSHSKVKRG